MNTCHPNFAEMNTARSLEQENSNLLNSQIESDLIVDKPFCISSRFFLMPLVASTLACNLFSIVAKVQKLGVKQVTKPIGIY